MKTQHATSGAHEFVAALRGFVARAHAEAFKDLDAVREKMSELSKRLDDRPMQGKSAYEIAVERGFAGSADAWLASLAGVNGKDGQDGKDGVDGQNGLHGKDGAHGVNGKDGQDGYDGRDALQMEVLPEIEAGRRYKEGTFAHHDGGMVRAFRSTDPIESADHAEACGWRVVVSGIKESSFVRSGKRGLVLRSIHTNGDVSEVDYTMPVMLYENVFKEGVTYERGDTVTFGGSLWHANEETDSKPGDGNSAWTLAAKRGRDGRDK